MNRNLVLLAIIVLTTVSCTRKSQNQEKQAQPQPTPLTEAEKRDIEIQDSLKQVKLDSLALIAWGDAIFGMSMKQTLATNVFKNGLKHSDEIVMDFGRKRKFEEALGLNLYSIRSDFKENELFRVRIKSYYLTADKIDILLRDCNIFINNFKEKYGDPSFIKDKVNISEFDNMEEIEYSKFHMGTKNITILLKRESFNYTYYYLINIENSQFPKKKRVPTEKDKKEAEKHLKELKEVKANSF